MRTVPILFLALTLAACGKADNEPGPGGVTVGEARALDEAAQMMEDQRLPAAAIPPAAAPAAPPPAPPAAEAKAKPAG